MSDQLSAEGTDLMKLCDSISIAVASAISNMVGDPASGIITKIGASGTATKIIDVVAEDAVLSQLRMSGTGFRVLSEEIGDILIGREPEYFIHLDPLDGTFNAIHGIPFYAVSLYLASDRIRLGYVCDLARMTRYCAEAGRGAYASPGGRLSVSKTTAQNDFSISAYTLRPNTGRIVPVGDQVRRIRTLGSTSLEMCYVAAGKLDAFVDLRGRMRAVDMAAGKLIIEEAGGLVTSASGREIEVNADMWQRTDLIGSNGLIHDQILGLIGGAGN